MKSTFKKGSGLFVCRSCNRRTRDVEDNGNVKLCLDCFEAAGYENTASDTSDPAEKARNEALAKKHYQHAVNVGGAIPGFQQEV